MSSLSTLKPYKGSKHSKKRVGRGNGSGHGTFSTRGNKGQKARSGGNIAPRFEGGQTPLVRRLPKLRGFKNPTRVEYQVVNVSALNVFNDGDMVDVTTLFEKGLIRANVLPVKILGGGELTKKLTVKIDRVVASARAKIESAKGSVQELLKTSKTEDSKEA